MSAIAAHITSLMIVYSTVYPGADQSKHQSSASLAFVWGIHRGPVNSPHKWPVTRKMFPFDDVIMHQTTMKHITVRAVRIIHGVYHMQCDAVITRIFFPKFSQYTPKARYVVSLLWRHNGRDGVSNHQPHDCLLNRLFRRRSKKTSKLRVTGLCAGNSPVSLVNSPYKWPVTRKVFPFDDVIMSYTNDMKS